MYLLKNVNFYISLLGLFCTIIFSFLLSKPQEPIKFIQKPSRPPFKEFIAASGIIESTDMNINIGPPIPGVVENLWVQVGNEVKKGDCLFQIDSRNLYARLDLEKANLDLVLNQLKKQKELYERVSNAPDYLAVSKEEVDTRKADFDIEKSKVIVAEKNILLIREEIERMIIRAPIDGNILQVAIRRGMYVSDNKPAILMGNTGSLQVRVDIDEFNIVRFNPSNRAVAYPKNDSSVEIPLHFVRIEPFVIPKKNLTGLSEERVDTRVLQVIYSFDPIITPLLFVGQQVDVYVEINGDRDE